MPSQDKKRKPKAPNKKDNKPEGYTFGRPTKYRPEFCHLVIEHMKQGLSFESFAGKVGVWKEAIYEWIKKHEDFANAVKVGRAAQRYALEKMALAQALGKFKGAPATTIFVLKNTIGWRDQPDTVDADYEEMEFI